MFKGSVYCAKWEHPVKDKNGEPVLDRKGQPKIEKRKAWGIRYRIDGGRLIRKV